MRVDIGERAGLCQWRVAEFASFDQPFDIEPQIGLMLVDIQFFADLMTDNIVTLGVEIRPDFFAKQSQYVQTYDVELLVGQSSELKIFDKIRVEDLKLIPDLVKKLLLIFMCLLDPPVIFFCISVVVLLIAGWCFTCATYNIAAILRIEERRFIKEASDFAICIL